MGGKRKSATRRAREAMLRQVNLNAAGIDVGSERHFVAVPEGRDADTVRSFGSVTGELERLVAWLEACEIETVAMESTGVYWIPPSVWRSGASRGCS